MLWEDSDISVLLYIQYIHHQTDPRTPPLPLLLSARVCVKLDFAQPQFHWTGSHSRTEVITKERSSWRIFLDCFAFFLQCREIGSDSPGAAQCVPDEPSARNFG